MKHIQYIHKLRREKIIEKLEDVCREEGIALLFSKIDWDNDEIGSLYLSPAGQYLNWVGEEDTIMINKIKCIK
jgi:hypothetical protein